MMKTIHCSDCGQARKTRYSNTKYCILCRMARNLKFIGETILKCKACGEEFAPLKRGDIMCGKCDNIPAAGDPHGECGLCHSVAVPIVNEDIAVCHPCSTDPSKREIFTAALFQKRRLRMEAHA